MLPNTSSANQNDQSSKQSTAPQYPQIGQNNNPAQTKSNRIEVPSITLPKGGGAIKSIDEKFQVNAANGTASFSLPFPASPGRSGFTPGLGLSYNSGGGNSPFGLGWNMDAASIQRKTDKKLPEYRDTTESDTFVYSGAEDLVPSLDEKGQRIVSPDGSTTRYRPRIEGGFAKIERIREGKYYWWRVTTRDNAVSVFGQSAAARLADPQDDTRIFQWMLEYTYDDKGNYAEYRYKAENLDNVAPTLPEKNRLNGNAPFANIYLKSVHYGNEKPWYTGDPSPDRFLFEIVLDYGEHEQNKPTTKETTKWLARPDAFSEYRAGFEVRTWRLCRRVLMFHHFPDELGQMDYLVRSMDFRHEEHPHLTYLEAITQTGYIWNKDGTLKSKRTMPPMEFRYFKPGFNTKVQELPPESLANLPAGLDESNYQWTDLYSEGISGILTEQGTGWYYKENMGDGQFSPARLVSPKPSFSGLNGGGLQIQDLEANGKKYLVSNEVALHGYFELSPDAEWQSFRPFEQFPTLDLRDPNVKFLDLNGDGLADILVSDDSVFRWYASKGIAGYDDHRTVQQAQDDEKGPRVLFAEKNEQVLIAQTDMSGDGFGDIVRITNSEVCYWPNLGYGRFGAKVTMGFAGAGEYLFASHPDQFDPQFLHFADIDGSGTTDLIYIGENKIKVWFNQSGNRLSEASELFNPFPKLDNLSRIAIVDLLGNGTSCLVWSSPLPQDAHSPLRYIDLMGGQKPHVMQQYINNLGKETTLEYKPSTWFYLRDKKAGKKWATKLPFPVQLVFKVVVEDKVSQTRFANEYSYHHGYYDGEEREFRGFALVVQKDTEAYEHYAKETAASGALNTVERDLYQPAVITKTWFHTGAFLSRDRIYHQLREEYYPDALVKQGLLQDPAIIKTLDTQLLPEAQLPAGMTTPELLECLRALKGLPLRQEVYSDEGDELLKQHPYSVVQNNYDIQRLQSRLEQRHAVFFPFQKETLTFNYERNPLDPRVAHAINIEIDPFGNVLQSAAVVYGRRMEDHNLPTQADRAEQTKTHTIYTENRFSNAIDDATGYHLPVTCETLSWELQPDKPAGLFYLPEELSSAFAGATVIPYFEKTAAKQKRKIEHIRTLFLKNNLSGLLPLGRLESLALPGQAYQLALTPALVPVLYGDKVNDALLREQARYVRSEGDDNYWIASGGILSYPDLSANPLAKTISPPTAADVAFAKSNFYLPVVYEDNFGHLSKVFYDQYRLFITKTIDALDNESAVESFNFRTLAPWLMRDANGNRSGVRFDEVGLVMNTFSMGKTSEQLGDRMETTSSESSPSDEPGSRLSYEFRYFDTGGKLPNRVKIEAREQHFFQDDGTPFAGPFIWQASYAYSDGSGHEVLKKVQAEPGDAPARDAAGKLIFSNGKLQRQNTGKALRWVGNGRTILNNKGNPVKQYEPYFDSSPEYNDEAELVELGFTPVLFYDAMSRLIRTEQPNGTFTKVEFDAWMQRSWDENDTVMDSRWHIERIGGQRGADEKDAAQKAEICDKTPTAVYLDSLGRTFLSIAHNRTQHSNEAVQDEFYVTRSEYDIEGNPRSVTDARGNTVMRWHYDMLGAVCRQESMDAGTRWQLNDVMGKSLHTWDSRKHTYTYRYDALHRPFETRVSGGDGPSPLNHVFERFEYGENASDAATRNLRGKPWRHYDTAGRMESTAFDFKGNLLEGSRTLLQDYKNIPDWGANPSLEQETFSSSTRFDALNRPISSRSPDGSLMLPEYNEANLLNALRVRLRGAPQTTTFVSNIDYNAKGQRESIHYGNNTSTWYTYEPETYRLTRLQTKRGFQPPALDGGGLQDLKYSYDPVGNITRIFDNAQKTVFYDGQKVEALSEYRYDALHRLTEASGREHRGQVVHGAQDNWNDAWSQQRINPNDTIALRNYTQHYHYDPVGNFLRMRHEAQQDTANSWTRQYQYATDSNRLLATGIGANAVAHYTNKPDLTYRYTYNTHGSMATMPHLRQIDWDFREQISHVDLVGGGQAWYVYDAGGQRTRKVIERQGGVIEERIYLGGFEVYRERNAAGVSLERETLHIMPVPTQAGDDKNRVAIIETRTKGDDGSPLQLQRFQYANHLGTACLELNEDGVVISYEEFHPYGTTAYQAVNRDIRAAAKRYRYTGMERDEETGLEYHSARYYAGWIGRWIRYDSAGYGDGFNLYMYVRNNPIRYADSTGNQCDSTIQSCSDTSDSTLREEALQQSLPEEERNLPPISELPRTPRQSNNKPSAQATSNVSTETPSTESSEWELMDNPFWNAVTDNTVSGTTGLLEAANPRFVGSKVWDTGLHIENALYNTARKLPGVLGKSGTISGSNLPVGMSRASAVLAPLGVLSNGKGFYDAIAQTPGTNASSGLERSGDIAASAAGFFSSMVGTFAIAGVGLEAAGATTLGGAFTAGAAGLAPAAALAGAGAGGFALGQLYDKSVGGLMNITGASGALDRWRGINRPTGQHGNYTYSGMAANLATTLDQSLVSGLRWVGALDTSRPEYTQTIGWRLTEVLPSWLQ